MARTRNGNGDAAPAETEQPADETEPQPDAPAESEWTPANIRVGHRIKLASGRRITVHELRHHRASSPFPFVKGHPDDTDYETTEGAEPA